MAQNRQNRAAAVLTCRVCVHRYLAPVLRALGRLNVTHRCTIHCMHELSGGGGGRNLARDHRGETPLDCRSLRSISNWIPGLKYLTVTMRMLMTLCLCFLFIIPGGKLTINLYLSVMFIGRYGERIPV